MAIGTKDYMINLGDIVLAYFYQDVPYDKRVKAKNLLEQLPDNQYQFGYTIYGLTGDSMRRMIEISDTWDIPVKFFNDRITFTPKKFSEI